MPPHIDESTNLTMAAVSQEAAGLTVESEKSDDSAETEGSEPAPPVIPAATSDAAAIDMEETSTSTDATNAVMDAAAPVDADATATATAASTTEVADPWAVTATADSSKAAGEADAPLAEQKPLGARWGSFRNRVETKWKNRSANSTAAAMAMAMAEDTETATTTTTTTTKELTTQEKASLRASKISVTVQKTSQESKWGFGLEPHPKQPEKVQIGIIAAMGLLEHAPFQVGDVLTAINNQKCTNAEATIQALVKFDGGIPITLQVETPGNPNLVQAMVKKPNADANLGISFFVPVEEKEKEEEEETPASTAPDSKDSDGLAEKPDTKQEAKKHAAKKKEAAPPKVLHINNIDANGLLSHSALSQGDWVVAINATPCSQLSAEEAEELLKQSDDTVTITAMKPHDMESGNRMRRFVRQAKRAGIALGGGTMVGIGLIFIPTLPPPFGEVLIVGGVSVLGTEFEAPKRVMRSARDSLERAVGREDPTTIIAAAEKTTDDEQNDAVATGEESSEPSADGDTAPLNSSISAEDDADTEGNATDTTDTTDSNAKPNKKTMGERFKNFGRKVVLPFLDQVVGDRKEEEENPEEENSTRDVSVVEETNTTIVSGEEAEVVSQDQTDSGPVTQMEATPVSQAATTELADVSGTEKEMEKIDTAGDHVPPVSSSETNQQDGGRTTETATNGDEQEEDTVSQ